MKYFVYENCECCGKQYLLNWLETEQEAIYYIVEREFRAIDKINPNPSNYLEIYSEKDYLKEKYSIEKVD